MYHSHADVIKQLEGWGFRAGKTKYGKVLMRGPSGGHVWAAPASVVGRGDVNVVEQASRLLGVTEERFWQQVCDTDRQGSASLSKRFASSYQAEILRYLDRLPGSVLEDNRLGIAHAVWSILGERAGKNLSSCASAISALESDGRLASIYGHRSLDGRLCRVKVNVLAEPPAGSVLVPVDDIEATRSGGHGADQLERIQEEREKELIAHIEHLSEESMLWEDMAAELEAKLNEALAKGGGDDESVLDYFSKEIERRDVQLRWRTRQLERRSSTLDERNIALSSVKAELLKAQQDNAKLEQAVSKLEKSLGSTAAERDSLRELTAGQASELKELKATLLRVQERMFLSVFSAVSSHTLKRDAENDTLESLLAPPDIFFKDNGLKHHRYQSILSRVDGLGLPSLDFDMKVDMLPLQSIDEQPLDYSRLKRDLKSQVGSWYTQLLQMCIMFEDAGAKVSVKQSLVDGGWSIQLGEPIQITNGGKSLVVHGKSFPLTAVGGPQEALDSWTSIPASDELFVVPIRNIPAREAAKLRHARSQGQISVQNKDLLLTLADPALATIMVVMSDRMLSRAVPMHRVEQLLSSPGHHYGIRDSNEQYNAHNFAVGTALIGMAGIRKLENDPSDPRKLIIKDGEITDLYGRILFLNGDRADETQSKWTVHPTGRRDWLVELRMTHPDKGLFMSAVFGAK
jgi:hypothetical protein